jgi:hypothetical protein
VSRRAAAAVVLLAAALAAPAARGEALTIQLTSVVIQVKATDKKPRGQTSRGDRVFQRNKLLNTVPQFGKRRGTRVGTDEGTVTFTSAHSGRYLGVARLPGGTLKLRGVVRPLVGGGIRIPVVGGTGRFASATGALLVEAGEDRVLNVYRLTLPAVA